MEKVINDYLCEILRNYTTKYLDMPAVFNGSAPQDTDDGWNEDTQYPRAIFELNMQADPARKIAGQLYIDVMCENDANSVQPEELEAAVNLSVGDCFFSTEDLTISARWNRSDAFKQGEDDKVSGITLTFDILAFPLQTTTEPDPIDCVNSWLKTLYPDAKVIGKDVLPKVWVPTSNSPALYCRNVGLGDSPKMNSTYYVEWLQISMALSVIAPNIEVRTKMLRMITEILKSATRLMLSDNSPLMIDDIKVNHEANPLNAGQVQIKATYGVLKEQKATKLNHIYYKRGYEEREVSDGN